MSNGKPVIWLREGHVCGFTLPLPVNVHERWKAGQLTRVNEDGSDFQGAHYVLPGDAEPTSDGGGEGGGPDRPKKNASRIEWAAYAVALGAATAEDADSLTRDELIELTTAPEDKPDGGK
jgi:hypothetical protein